MNLLEEKIYELSSMKSYPDKLFYDGNLDLLFRDKISIVGSRRPSKYSRMVMSQLALTLSKRGIVVVSGGAMGIDAIAHHGAGSDNTISVLPCGIDIRYPSVNKNLLNDIQKYGLLLSQFGIGEKSRAYTFVQRNEIVVALGKVLIVGEADESSGTMRSVEFALKMGKEIFVIPHRIGESIGTNNLLKNNQAKIIYDIEEFANKFGSLKSKENKKDDFLDYCKTNPNYDDAIKKFSSKIFEAELNSTILVKNGKIFLV